MLEAIDVTFKAGGRELISGVTVAFAPGKLHLIVGPKRRRQSTLIKCSHDTFGRRSAASNTTASMLRRGEADLARRRAVLSQAVEAAFPLTAREIVMMGRYPHFGGRPGPVDEKIVDEMMRLFDVAEFAVRNYQTLSGGERQRGQFCKGPGTDLDRLAKMHRTKAAVQGIFSSTSPLTFLTFAISWIMKMVETLRTTQMSSRWVSCTTSTCQPFCGRCRDARRKAASRPLALQRLLTSENIRNVFGVEPSFIPAAGAGTHLVFD